jgi:restriction endonuclease S subunit
MRALSPVNRPPAPPFCGIIRAKANEIAEWLGFWFRSQQFADWRRSQARGANIQNLRFSQIEHIEIPVPPLPEQHRIAAILTEQMAAVAKARAGADEQLEAARALPAAYLRAVFNSPEAQGWPKKRLDEVSEVLNGFGFREDMQGRTDLPFPFIKVSDMNAAGSQIVVHRAANTADHAILKLLRAKTYPRGTVIFPKVGGALLTNKKRVLGVEATFDNNVMGIVPKGVECDWVYLWMLTVDLRDLANTQALPSIRQTQVGGMQIPLPPVQQRREIAAQLSEQMAGVDRLRKSLEEQLAEIKALPAALLRRTFAGEL